MIRRLSRLASLCLVAVLAACGGQSIQGVASVEILGGDRAISLGSDVLLSAKVTAGSGVDTTVTWSSSSEAVATVNGAGVITPHALGSTTVTATSAADTTKSASAVVTVTAPNLTDDAALMVSLNMPAGGPAAVAAGLLFIDLSAPSPGPTPASVTDVGDGEYAGPVSPVAADGSAIIRFPDGSDLPEEIFTTPVDFAYNFSVIPSCELAATDTSAMVTYAVFEFATVPGVVLYLSEGRAFAAVTDQPIDVATPPTVQEFAAMEFITWVYSDSATQVSTPEGGCGPTGAYTVAVDLVAGWNQLSWRLVLDDTNTNLEGFTLGNSSTTEYHVTPMID